MILFFCLLSLFFGCTSVFLGKELIKKFGFWKKFELDYQHKVSWIYPGNLNPGMYRLQLSGKSKFSALIGFDFSVLGIKDIGYDIFGYIESSPNGSAECILYLGKGGVEFIFLLDKENDIEFMCTPWEGMQTEYIFHPHWWQKL